MMRHRQPTHYLQAGMTIVEIMIALTISLILMAGVIQIFISSKSTYRMQDESARIQENGRFAAEFMARDIRMAGYTGCASRQVGRTTNTLNSSNLLAYNFNVGIEGEDNVTTSPTYLSSAGITPNAGTDVIIIRRNADLGIRVTQSNNSSQLFAELKSKKSNACSDGGDMWSGLCIGDIVMVSDCEKSRVLQITNLQGTAGSANEMNVVHSKNNSGGTLTPGNALSSWGGASAPPEEQFGPGSEIVKIVTYAYYVADNADGVPSLYRTEGAGGAPLELIEGVEDMQVEYGEDTSGEDGVADVYRTANNVTDWARVVSARLNLLLRSDSANVTDNEQPVWFDDATFTPATGDRYLRRSLTKTITLRNRTT